MVFFLLLSFLVPVVRAAETPPLQVVAVDASAVGPSALNLTGATDHQAAFEGSVSFLQRRRLGRQDWYWGWGLRTDAYAFDNRGEFPVSHLQDYAAQFSLEYVVHGQPAAWLTLHPGLYYERVPTLSAWDIPVEAASGIPISASLSGVLGVDYARFYYLPVPIAGFSWAATPRLRVDAIYPNPALVYQIDRSLEGRVGGELIGGAFRSDAETGKSHLSYFEYRVGTHLAWKAAPGLKLDVGAGYVAARTFEFLPSPLRIHANAAPFVHLGLQWSR